MATTLFTIVHLFICFMLIVIVLLQQGKGADAGATFGGGGNTVFGSAGADNFLTKVTTFIALAFMCTSVYLALDAKDARANKGSLVESLPSSLPVGNTVNTSGIETGAGTSDSEPEAADTSSAEASNTSAEAVKPESEAFTAEAKAPAAADSTEPAETAQPAAEEKVAEEQKTEDSPSK